jgi:CubicO group peptidase (beta-lactamase class C family)
MKFVAASLVLALAAGPAPDPVAPSIDSYVQAALDSTGLPGLAVVVTRGDKVIRAVGAGHDSTGQPITEQTPMRLASVSKSFTAMAVMELVEAGRVRLDDPVAAQLPEFRMADPRYRVITVRQLLTQTSGLADDSLDYDRIDDTGSLPDLVSALDGSALAADPGSTYSYCNANYDLLARLVEAVSGQPLQDYLRDHVFAPLGMTRSSVDDRLVRPAEGYNSLFGLWVAQPEPAIGPAIGGSGSVISTAADLGPWLIAQNGKGPHLVSDAALTTMHAPSPVHDYAMGWAPMAGPDGTHLSVHSGNLFTYNAIEAVDGEYGYAVLTNGAGLYDDTADVLDGLVRLTHGEHPDAPGGSRQLVELVLAVLGLLAIGLAVLGVWRSRRWAERRSGRTWWRIALRLVPAALPVAVLAGYPWLVSVLIDGRHVTWAQLWYFALPVTVLLLVAAASGLVVLGARSWRLWSIR